MRTTEQSPGEGAGHAAADPDEVVCPDCFGRGRLRAERCSLCQGKGGINWRTCESVPAKDIGLGPVGQHSNGSHQGKT